MNYQSIKLIVVDDQSLFREGIKAILNPPDFSVIGEAEEGSQLLELLELKKMKPDIILLDIDMPNGLDGRKTLAALTSKHPHLKVIMLSMFDDDNLKRDFIKSGAKAYLTKRTDFSVFTETIRKVHSWDWYSNIPENFKSKFSPRELKIINLLLKGLQNNQIAEKVFVSVKTVELDRSNIYQKIGAANFQQFVIYCTERGLKYLGKE